MIANLSDAKRALFYHGEHGGHREGASQKTPFIDRKFPVNLVDPAILS
jgi:hypothetical protein